MKAPPPVGERVCDPHATRWGTVAVAGQWKVRVIWDAAPNKTCEELVAELCSEKHPNKFGLQQGLSYVDPQKQIERTAK